MKNISFAIIMTFLVASGVYSATVLVEPAIQDSPPVGGTLSISVKVKDVVDLYAHIFDVSFDKTAIELLSIEEGNFLRDDILNTLPNELVGKLPQVTTKSGGFVPYKDITTDVLRDINSNSEFTILNTRTGLVKGVDDAGTLVILKFKVIEAKSSNIVLKNAFEDPNLNPILADSNANPITTDLAGAVINQPVCVKGDVDNDGKIEADDAILALKISVDLLTPTTQQFCAADMNNDNKIRSDDVIAILHKAVGGAPDRNLIAGGTINVKLDEAHGVRGESITVPLRIDQPNVVAGGDVLITYDSSVLKAVEVSSAPNTLIASNIAYPGIIKVSFAGLTGTVASRLAEIKFDVISDDVSPLKLQDVELYESNSLPLKLRKIDGLFGSWAMPAKDNALLQNFPNPFNPETWIPYQLKQDSEVTIKIYTTTGELVRELDLGHKFAGIYVSRDRSAYWDGKDKFGITVASGVYFYSIKTKDFSAVKKLTILK